MPGESRELALNPLPPGAKVEVIATILEDTTAIGDEAALGSIFAHRTQERDAMKAVVDAFNEVLTTLHGVEALTALRDRLAALVARGDNVPCHAALDAVQAFQQKTDAEAIDASLRNYAEFVAGSTSSPRSIRSELELGIRNSAVGMRARIPFQIRIPITSPPACLPAARRATSITVRSNRGSPSRPSASTR